MSLSALNVLEYHKRLLSWETAVWTGRAYTSMESFSVGNNASFIISYTAGALPVAIYDQVIISISDTRNFIAEIFDGGSLSGGALIGQIPHHSSPSAAPFASILADPTVTVPGASRGVIGLLSPDGGLWPLPSPEQIMDAGHTSYMEVTNVSGGNVDVFFSMTAAGIQV